MARGRKTSKKHPRRSSRALVAAPRRRSRRGGSRKLPMPTMKTVIGASMLVGMDVVDAAIIDLPDTVHPWSAGLALAGYFQRKPDLIEAGYMVEIAHICREKGLSAKLVQQVLQLTGGQGTGENASGGGL